MNQVSFPALSFKGQTEGGFLKVTEDLMA